MTDGLYGIYTHGWSGGHAYTCTFVYTHMYASASLVCARVYTYTRDYKERRVCKSGWGWSGEGVETFFRSLKQYDTATRLHLACVYSPLCWSRRDVPRPPPTAAAANRRRKYKNPRCECVARVAFLFMFALLQRRIWRGRDFLLYVL